ncbi:hypothetical protein C3489_17155 [Streptomyces sp. Ru71]|uniref:hypothetical protein n=1 Tax=Streptomyces sp. Ru71 TaxID=2080746 RepID=UPI000CDDC297|nr:hypothetical protein [Streptomyces sp. Ru71]POX52708.1 hypothetical protein C3489_17155 [Streptomyces sp. Ru71]
MDTVLAALVAVAGTLIGSLTTYVFQRRTTEHANAAAREERRRQERLAACSGYAVAVTELKRGVITLWFRRRASPPDQDAWMTAQIEADRLGAAAEAAAFHLHLVADDPALRRLMNAISAKIAALDEAEDRDALRGMETEFEQAVHAFLDEAARRIR